MRETAAAAAQRAVACGGIIVAAGGDGTINTVAQAALEAGCPIGVIARGTFNYFARTHGIPAEPSEAAKLLLSARPQPVQVGLVNGRIILVNASVGLYPKLLEERELHSRKYGRSRFGALVAALRQLLRERRHLRLRIESDGTLRQVRTPTLFIGNNPLQLQQLGLPAVQMLACGRLVAVVPRAVGLLSLLWLMLRGAFGKLGNAADIADFSFRTMTVRPRRTGRSATGKRMKVAIDGEVVQLASPLELCVCERPLLLLKPQRAIAESAAGVSVDA